MWVGLSQFRGLAWPSTAAAAAAFCFVSSRFPPASFPCPLWLFLLRLGGVDGAVAGDPFLLASFAFLVFLIT
jgi:hypothetical protein